MELVNAEGNVVEKWNKDELKTHGWDVEVKSFPVDEDDPKGPQYVRAIVVPAGKEGTNASNMYLPDQRSGTLEKRRKNNSSFENTCG